jgi:AcrR family transcriptional regulator
MPPPTTSSRRPLRERKKLRARELIVETAYQLFDRHGFALVTVPDIVDAAEVSRSTFFRYFGDKQEVVFADAQQLRDALVAEARATPAPSPHHLREALEQLRDLTVGAYQLAGTSPRSELHEQLIDANPELMDRHIRKLMGFADDMTALLITRGAEPGTARLAGHLAIACCLAARGGTVPGDMAAAVSKRFDEVIRLNAR